MASIAGFFGAEGILGGKAAALVPASADGEKAAGWLGYWGRRQQPVHDRNNSLWVVYEGVIQNRRQLQEKLAAAGFPAATDEPGELILRAYQAWGEQSPEAIEGTCAFLLWDAKAQWLLAARDRVGMHRLYLAQEGNTLAVATDVASLLEVRACTPKPNPKALVFALTLGYVPSGFSIWQGVVGIGPGQCIAWTPGQEVRIRRYWEPPRVSQDNSTLPWKEVFEAAVGSTIEGGEPVGLLLSGGLDSTSIALASRRIGRTVMGLSFSGQGVPDESNLAMQLAEHLKLPTVGPVHIPAQDVNGLLDEVAAVMQEPQCHTAILTSYAMSRAASPYFKVLLTGDGAEEVFGGHPWYDEEDGPRSRRMAALLRRLAHYIPYPSAVRASYRKSADRFAHASALHRHVWHVRKVMFLPSELRTFLGPSAGEFREEEMLAPMWPHYEPRLPYRRSLQRLDTMTFCADALLPKIRRMAAAHGVEIRLPFLDRRVIDWAIAYPFEKRERKYRKPVLRDYLRGYVPKSILKLPKHGFNPPWLNTYSWKPSLEEIRAGYWVKEGYWSPAWEDFVKAGAPYWKERLWTLTVLTRWASIWMR